MNLTELKKKILDAIDNRAGEIIDLGEKIFRQPELGYREHKTAALVKKELEKLGIACRDGLAITGLAGGIPGRRAGGRVAVMGELDALICPGHPHADPITGAAHACGHHAQLAAMLGVAMSLADTGAMAHLDGEVLFLAVPGEEYSELEFRQRLREEGKLWFFGGKQEFVRLGELDGVDAAMMVHAHGGFPGRGFLLDITSSGFVGKSVRYFGREAHAGAAPEEGVNALNAAMLGLMAIHAQRETFRDQDGVRVHPVLSKGGDMVNIVPADVRMETYVRAKNPAAVEDACRKVDRALRAGADGVGAQVEITDIPGYLPLSPCKPFYDLFAANAAGLVGPDNILRERSLLGSTDAGDLSALMPLLHPTTGGYTGGAHSTDFAVTDPEMAYVIPAKAMALTVADLLWDGAGALRGLRTSFVPAMDKEKYLAYWKKFDKKPANI